MDSLRGKTAIRAACALGHGACDHRSAEPYGEKPDRLVIIISCGVGIHFNFPSGSYLWQDFVASYRVSLPFERLFSRSNRLTEGWAISGTTRFTTGFPVTLYDDSDSSLLATLGNGVNNSLLDTPEFTPGPLEINTNPRNGRPAFTSR